jgi:hypothetical protein
MHKRTANHVFNYVPVSSRRTIAAPSDSAFNLAKATARGMYFMPQSGAGISRYGGRCASAARMRAATMSGVSGAGSPMLMTRKSRSCRQGRPGLSDRSWAGRLRSRSAPPASPSIRAGTRNGLACRGRHRRSRSRDAARSAQGCRRGRVRSPAMPGVAPPRRAPAVTARRAGSRRRRQPSDRGPPR